MFLTIVNDVYERKNKKKILSEIVDNFVQKN